MLVTDTRARRSLEVQLPIDHGGEKIYTGSEVMCVEGIVLVKHKHRRKK